MKNINCEVEEGVLVTAGVEGESEAAPGFSLQSAWLSVFLNQNNRWERKKAGYVEV